MIYELVLEMKVKPCIDPQDWGGKDLDFPRIYVWNCNDIQRVYMLQSGAVNETNLQLGENAAKGLQIGVNAEIRWNIYWIYYLTVTADRLNIYWIYYLTVTAHHTKFSGLLSNFRNEFIVYINNYNMVHKLLGEYDNNDIESLQYRKIIKKKQFCACIRYWIGAGKLLINEWVGECG